MGIIEKDGMLLFTHDMRIIYTKKTYDIMAIKIQKWWKPFYYKNLIEKALNEKACRKLKK